jgi:hypothetical protein
VISARLAPNRERRWHFCVPLLMSAAGIALISSFGCIASFLAPYLIGWMRDTTQSASLVFRTNAAIVNPQ